MTLLSQVKRKLNITWEDAETDARVTDMMNQATSVMLFKLGIADADFDFSIAGLENMLFLAYCLYLYNHVENEFEDNYKAEILQARSIHEVMQDDEQD